MQLDEEDDDDQNDDDVNDSLKPADDNTAIENPLEDI